MVHTFNDMYNANKQIILASDSYPKDMPALEERLKSRFMGGMLTSIDPPEVETRIAILQRKAEDIGIERLPDDVALYIAERVATNIRELEGALSTACRHAQLRGQELTLALARDVLRNRDEEEDSYRQPVTVDLIQRTVADHFQLKHTELKAKRRTKRVATARHVAMFLCRQLTDLSFVDIGQDFGGRDHSTVISACDKIERESQRSAQLSRLLEELREQVLGKHRRPRRGAM
jgi:chromosomal replication initiator protein